MAQLLADLVALSSGEDVAAFHHHDLAHLDSSFCEESPPVDRAFTLLDLWREMTEVELALAHSFTSDWPPGLGADRAMKGPRHHQHSVLLRLVAGGMPDREFLRGEQRQRVVLARAPKRPSRSIQCEQGRETDETAQPGPPHPAVKAGIGDAVPG